jgi:protein involved in polysaccharide export with SLBB domain
MTIINTFPVRIRSRRLSASLELKQAVISAFVVSPNEVARLFDRFDEDDWRRVMWWLDISGMALYLLQVLRSAGAESSIPPGVLASLEDRQARNRVRTQALMDEASVLCGWFHKSRIPYALLKGISLTPDSVPDPALRWQTDLDFLIPESSARLARRFMARLGYRMHGDTGSVLEFRAGSIGKSDIAKIYSSQTQRAVELHIAKDHSDLLAHREIRQIHGIHVATLSPSHIMLQQCVHLLKHLCGEHTRLSWLLEFRRHMDAKQADSKFWKETAEAAAATPNGELAISVGLWLNNRIFGPASSAIAFHFSSITLPDSVRLWLELFARHILLSDSACSKYYALLRGEVAPHSTEVKSTRSILIPTRLPLRITESIPNEPALARLARYSIETLHFLSRLRFHTVEGIRFAAAAWRWKRLTANIEVKPVQKPGEGLRKASCAAVVYLLFSACGAMLPVEARGQSAASTIGAEVVDRPHSPAVDPEAQLAPQDNDDSVMSSAALRRLLQSDPEIMVEAKPVVAQFLAQQDTSLTPDSISDQQIYDAVGSSHQFRKMLTDFLRARGYVSEEQIQAASDSQQDVPLDQGMRRTESASALSGTALFPSAPGSGKFQGASLQDRPDRTTSPPGLSESNETSRGDRLDASRNVTDEPEVLRRPAPYNLLSLRDLYTQVPDNAEHLKRFGSDVFVMRGKGGDSAAGGGDGISSLDTPVGPDYVLGPGDQLSISIWGGVSENLLRPVNREGGVALPEAGLIQVAGLTLGKAQEIIENALRTQYRNEHVAVTVAGLRSIRIFVVGDVQRPGSYEVSSVASPLSALYAAGGPTAVGSLRVLRHYRNEKLVGEIDLYDFMLHGIRATQDRLQTGDTLLVPPVGPQVAIFGAIKRPAIYELRNEKDLAEALEDAGGLTVAASLTHITVDRVVANEGRQEVGVNADLNEDPALTLARLAHFAIRDGDRVHITTVLPANDRIVYVQGHVARPGKIAYHDNMRLSDVLRSYSDLLPEPADTGEIVRLVAPDMHPETIEFNLPDALIGNSSLTLQPFDTVRVFGRYEQDAPTVTVRGEVQRPGSYPLFDGMTASQLVRAAGGFKRDALLSRADLTSYDVISGTRVSVSRRDVPIGAAVLKQDRSSDVQLKSGEILTIHQISGWNDIGASITIEGEVAHPGAYGFQEGEHLSDVLRRAGGIRAGAYPEGAVLTRPEVAALEQKGREELIRQIETSSAAARMKPGIASSDQSATLQLIQQQQDQVIAQLKSESASGRLVIHISQDLESWAGTAADVEVRRGDVLKVPKRPGFVLVSGQVYNATAITYTPNKTAGWYLERAGGATEIANRKEVFVIRANGEVIGRRSSGWLEHDVLATKLEAGDTVVVPQRIIGASLLWRNLLGTAQVAASLAIAAAVTGL